MILWRIYGEMILLRIYGEMILLEDIWRDDITGGYMER